MAHTVAAATASATASPDPVSNTTPAEYVAMVAKAKDYIRAGDAFQIVLSQRFSAPFTLPLRNPLRTVPAADPYIRVL